jgi:subtilisin family serine protease
MRPLAVGSLLTAALAVAATCSAVQAGSSPPALRSVARRAVVGPEVRMALAARAWVRVIVALRPTGRSPSVAATSERRIAASQQAVLRRLASTDFRTADRWRTIPGLAGEVTAAGLAKLAADPQVVRVDLDPPGGGDDSESLPLIRGDVVHAQGFLGVGTTVAILDSGVDRADPDLAGAIVAEHCVVAPNGCPNGAGEQDGPGSAQDNNGHGTNVAGIVLSAGQTAPIGVAPAAKLVAIKVIDAQNQFEGASQVISGLDWLIANHPEVRVVNMSLGTSAVFPAVCNQDTAFTRAFASAIDTLRSRGALVFASTGNSHDKSNVSAPACVALTVAVGAVYDSNLGTQTRFGCTDQVTAADRVACFSDSSPALDLLAPGALITSTALGSGTSTYVGTSQASPHAAGAAAVLLGAVSSATADQVESTLEATGPKLTDPANGRVTPRVDVAAALAALRAGAPPPSPPPPPPPPPPPAPPPLPTLKVRALASSGQRGRLARLRFAASDGERQLRFKIRIRSGPRLIGLRSTGYTKAKGGVLVVRWHVPKSAPAKLRFCVRGYERSGRASNESCAPLAVSS